MPFPKTAAVNLLDNWVLMLQKLFLDRLYNFKRSNKFKPGVLLPSPAGWICVFLLRDPSQLPYLSCDLSSVHPLIPPLHLFSFEKPVLLFASDVAAAHVHCPTSNVVLCCHMRPRAGWTKKPRSSQTFPYLTPPSGCLASFRLRFFMIVPLLFWKSCSSCHARLDRSRGNTDCPFSCISLYFKRMTP